MGVVRTAGLSENTRSGMNFTRTNVEARRRMYSKVPAQVVELDPDGPGSLDCFRSESKGSEMAEAQIRQAKPGGGTSWRRDVSKKYEI